jgi:hypothetical protein
MQTTLAALTAATLALAAPIAPAIVADREVAWVVIANESSTERELNAEAARGLRLATVTDGLACPVAVMQTPNPPARGSASYRLVADRELAEALPGLTDGGWEPRGLIHRLGGRAHVIWEQRERPKGPRIAAWRPIEFSNPDTLEADLAAAAREGFQPRLLARNYLRSWPGLSEKGLLLMARRTGATPREIRVLRGTKRDGDDLAKEVEALTSAGWALDVAFTASRDGNRTTRRERAYLIFSREAGTRAPATPLRLVRATSWGMVGAGEPVFGAAYWNDLLFVFHPAERRQSWATPIRLSAMEAQCGGLAMKLRIDGQREQRSTIVGAATRPVQGTDGFELVLLLDERLGG